MLSTAGCWLVPDAVIGAGSCLEATAFFSFFFFGFRSDEEDEEEDDELDEDDVGLPLSSSEKEPSLPLPTFSTASSFSPRPSRNARLSVRRSNSLGDLPDASNSLEFPLQEGNPFIIRSESSRKRLLLAAAEAFAASTHSVIAAFADEETPVNLAPAPLPKKRSLCWRGLSGGAQSVFALIFS